MDCTGKMDCGGQGPHVGLPEPLPAQPRPSGEEPGGAWSCFPPLGLFLRDVANWGAGKAGSGPGGCLGMCGSAHLSLKCRLGGRDGSAGKF